MLYPLARPSFAPPVAAAPRSQVHARAAELVSRYPNLSRPQMDELVAIFPRLSAMDVALIMADKQRAPRLEAFRAAHRDLVSPSLSDYAVIAAIMGFPLMTLLAVMVAS
jgi:hypothetical protein